MRRVNLNALSVEEADPHSPYEGATDFDFDAVDHQLADAAVTAMDERDPAVVLQRILGWLFFDRSRHRDIGLKYRAYAAAWVLNRGFFGGVSLQQMAKERRLNRVVLHRYIASFAAQFGIRKAGAKKK